MFSQGERDHDPHMGEEEGEKGIMCRGGGGHVLERRDRVEDSLGWG